MISLAFHHDRIVAATISDGGDFVLASDVATPDGDYRGWLLAARDAVDVLVVDVTPVNGGILLSYVDGGGTAKRSGRGKPRKATAGAGKAKRGAKAKARGKTGARGGKKSGKTRRSR